MAIRTGVLKSHALGAPGPESTGERVLGPESTNSAWHQDRSPEEPRTWCTRTGVNWLADTGTRVDLQVKGNTSTVTVVKRKACVAATSTRTVVNWQACDNRHRYLGRPAEPVKSRTGVNWKATGATTEVSGYPVSQDRSQLASQDRSQLARLRDRQPLTLNPKACLGPVLVLDLDRRWRWHGHREVKVLGLSFKDFGVEGL